MWVLVVASIVLAGVASRAARAQANIGKMVFDQACASCHGSDATGSLGPALVPFELSDQDLIAVVRAGGAQMRPMASRDIADDDVRAVAVYLRSLSGARAPRSNGPTGRSGPRPAARHRATR